MSEETAAKGQREGGAASAGAEKTGTSQRLDALTPAQRALLERRLMDRQGAVAKRRAISRRKADGPAPLSYSQELLWLLSQAFDYGIAYNSPGAFQLEGPLDLEVLANALSALSERHAILRTTYSAIDGHPMQIVQPPEPVELNSVDLVGLPADERYARAQEILKEESRFAFDLERGPVIRPTVIRFGDDEHILMFNLHHIATDGYSRGILYRDLTALYEAFAQSRPSPLEPLQIQYADFAVWQRDWLDSGIADAQIDYWKRKLARMPSRLELPTDFTRPPVRSDVGTNMSTSLDQEIREGLRAAARQCDATLFVALVSLFATLLSRYSGQDDLVIGTPFAGRNRTELESMVGYFINPLALRIDLSGDPTFAELVGRTRTTVLEAFAHADVAYETVVRAINPQRDMSQTPVFQAMIVLHNPVWQTQRPKFEPQGLRCTEITHEKGWAKFDVLLGMSERKTGLNTSWEYSTELFAPATIQRMMKHFGTLAESAAAEPNRRLSRLSMLSAGERAQVLFIDADRSLPSEREDSLKVLFERQAAVKGDATAVVCGDRRLTYDELNRRANRIAHALRAQGVGPGTLVGIMLQKSIDLVPAVLGVVKSGGAYVPLDPSYPEDRLALMLADAAPSVLVTHQEHLATLPPTSTVTLTIDATGVLDDFPEDNPTTTAGPDDLAYVIFTSGSTGKPKGAMIPNRCVVSAYHAWDKAYQLDQLTAHLQLASFSFDVFTGDLVRAMGSGAKLVLCPLEVVLDPPTLYELIVREGVDAAEFVPATAALLFDHVESEGKRLDGMKLIAVASEGWRTERYTRYKQLAGPRTRLVNSYGLTEATVDSTFFELAAGEELMPGKLVPIGRPFAGSQIYIVDANFEPQPVGIPGELCVGGTGVGLGYLNRPELTAEKFLPDPFSAEPGARMYRTGDLARWLPDGNIEFLGRADRQLKIRGFRIEPGEIESVLERHSGIRAAAVTQRNDERGDARLVAYVTLADASQDVPHDELRTLVADSLPAYMIPAAWVVVAALPVTPNGKVDHAALPDPEFDRSATTDEFVAPRTPVECRLAEVWADVLGVEQIGVHDNFFALGGHSLLAVRLFSEIERRLGARIPLAALFQTATIAGLAGLVDGSDGDGPSDESSPAIAVGTVVTMRAGARGKDPLFLICWAGGEVLGYWDLVGAIDTDVPIIGLRAPGADGDILPLATVEEMADHYIAEIRRIQPHGPYMLGGYCFAGLVAYEMASRLTEQGEELAMLALIDAYYHGSSRRPTRLQLERVKFRAFLDSDLGGKRAWLRRRLISLKNRVRTTTYFATGGLAYNILAVRGKLKRIPRGPWRLVLVASSRARRRYMPKPAKLQVQFFRAQTGASARTTPWEELALDGVELRQVIVPRINHESMMHAPHVSALAAELAMAIDGAANGAAPANGNGNGTVPADTGRTRADHNGSAAAANDSGHPHGTVVAAPPSSP